MALEPEVQELINDLTMKSRMIALPWRHQDDKFLMPMGNSRISITRSPEEAPASEPGFVFSILDRDGNVIWSTTQHPHDAEYAFLKNLHEVALKSVLKSVLSEVKELSASDQLRIHDEATISNAPPPLPSEPTQKQIEQILQQLAGDWNLDYTINREQARITDSGDYFVDSDNKAIPKFKLAVIACDAQLQKAEIAKNTLNGKRYDTESLTFVNDNLIEGTSFGTRKRLKYVRIGKR